MSRAIKDYIVIVKLETKPNAKSYDDIDERKYLKSLKWECTSGFPFREWTDNPEQAIRWHDEKHAKQAACLLQREVPWPLRVEHYIETEKEPNYKVLKTLGEIMKHKGEPLLFGYWDEKSPAYAWVAKVVDVKSPCSEKGDHDPDAYVDGLSIESTSDEFVKLYNGDKYELHGVKYNRTCAYKDTYGDPTFDGQLFCRTLTPSEKKIYNRVNRMKISFDKKPIRVFISEKDEILENIW